jgi:hypothetical protein
MFKHLFLLIYNSQTLNYNLHTLNHNSPALNYQFNHTIAPLFKLKSTFI